MSKLPSLLETLPAPSTAPAKASAPPPFTLRNVAGDIAHGVHALIFDPFYKRMVGPIVVFAASILTKVVISRVPYTEIDYSTYLQQIEKVNDGELDYANIYGDSGPIVYPAGFVSVYQFIYWITGNGEDIMTAQALFSYLFTFTLIMTMLTYTGAKIPPWVLLLLISSKRLISIYVLRMFNDCFTTAAMVAVTLILQQLSYFSAELGPGISFLGTLVAADFYSLAISVKMNALLYLPGFIIIVYFLNHENALKTVAALSVIPFVQVMVGWKFLLPLFNDAEAKAIRWSYLENAFNFKRTFLYKWTVNWKFLSQQTFESPEFHNSLLIGHFSLLLVFVFTKYLSPSLTGKPITQLVKDGLKLSKNTISAKNSLLSKQEGPKNVMLILATSNLIGVLASRSLHYQFLSWYAWQLPYLLYVAFPTIFALPLWLAHEYCWLVFPATAQSSAVLVSVLAAVLLGVWVRWHPAPAN